MTKQNDVVLYGWLASLLATLLLVAFVSSWWLIALGIVFLIGRHLPPEVRRELAKW